MLVTQNLNYQYSSGTTLNYADLELGPEQVHVLLGPSGSGKSSWLQLIAGLRLPGSGSHIALSNTPLHSLSSTKRDAHRARHMGIIYQEPVFIESVSVLDNLLLAQRLATGTVDLNRAQDLAKSLDIFELIKRKPRQLSTGQRQRAAIARALIHQPTLILADEPSSALDDERVDDLNKILREQARIHNTILVIITHDRRIIRPDDHIIHLDKIMTS